MDLCAYEHVCSLSVRLATEPLKQKQNSVLG